MILAVVFFCTAASAQTGHRAVGIRGGFGAEVSYQYGNNSKFVEADLGWAPGSVNVVGVFDFVFAKTNLFNFYAGPGAHLGIFGAEKDGRSIAAMSLGIVGQVGMEYPFPTVPINLSIDWRPVFNLVGGIAFLPYYGAFSVRYRF